MTTPGTSPRRCGVSRGGRWAVAATVPVSAVALALALAGCGGIGFTPSPTATPEPPDELAATLVDLTNEVREAEGLTALASSSCATDRALARAESLIGAELEHAPLTDVFLLCDVDVAGENLSRGAVPAADVLDAWMESPGHRANLLEEQYTAVGVACVPDDDDVLCAQIFLGE